METKLSQEISSYIYAVIMSFSWYSLNIVVKVFNHMIPWIQLSFYRGCVGFLLIYPIMRKFNVSLLISDTKLFLLVCLRTILGYQIGLFSLYFATRIPVSELMVLSATNTFILAVLEYIFYRRTYGIRETLSTFACIVGVILVVKPDIFNKAWKSSVELNKETSKFEYATGFEYVLCVFLVYLMNLGWALGALLIPRIKTVHVFTQSAYYAIAGVWISAIGQMEDEVFVFPGLLEVLGLGLIIGIIWIVNQLSFTRAYTIGRTPIIALLGNVQLVFAFFTEIVFFGENPTGVKIAGTLIIFASLVYVVLSRAGYLGGVKRV
jgi:drug/metabolite transporter (DMT)-like permease